MQDDRDGHVTFASMVSLMETSHHDFFSHEDRIRHPRQSHQPFGTDYRLYNVSYTTCVMRFSEFVVQRIMPDYTCFFHDECCGDGFLDGYDAFPKDTAAISCSFSLFFLIVSS